MYRYSPPLIHGHDRQRARDQIVAERIRPTVETLWSIFSSTTRPRTHRGYGPYRNTGNFDIATPAKLFSTRCIYRPGAAAAATFPELSWPANSLARITRVDRKDRR